MSKVDLHRIEILSDVLTNRKTVESASDLLGLSDRQTYRLLSRYRIEGALGIAHKSRGRKSNRSTNEGIRSYALDLVRSHYADFGPTLAAEMLATRHGVVLGRETLRRWMIAEKMWMSRTQRKRFHQPRFRRERVGELVQAQH